MCPLAFGCDPKGKFVCVCARALVSWLDCARAAKQTHRERSQFVVDLARARSIERAARTSHLLSPSILVIGVDIIMSRWLLSTSTSSSSSTTLANANAYALTGGRSHLVRSASGSGSQPNESALDLWRGGGGGGDKLLARLPLVRLTSTPTRALLLFSSICDRLVHLQLQSFATANY